MDIRRIFSGGLAELFGLDQTQKTQEAQKPQALGVIQDVLEQGAGISGGVSTSQQALGAGGATRIPDADKMPFLDQGVRMPAALPVWP
jgi:hypothetical protein